MLEETTTIESDAGQVKSQRLATLKKRRVAKPRQKKPAAVKAEIPLSREIVLRLIELFREA